MEKNQKHTRNALKGNTIPKEECGAGFPPMGGVQTQTQLPPGVCDLDKVGPSYLKRCKLKLFLIDFERQTILSAEERGLTFEDFYSGEKVGEGLFSFKDARGLRLSHPVSTGEGTIGSPRALGETTLSRSVFHFLASVKQLPEAFGIECVVTTVISLSHPALDFPSNPPISFCKKEPPVRAPPANLMYSFSKAADTKVFPVAQTGLELMTLLMSLTLECWNYSNFKDFDDLQSSPLASLCLYSLDKQQQASRLFSVDISSLAVSR
ncbi:hypothetical protein STEG23_014540, partial [Scotinomys teguina]